MTVRTGPTVQVFDDIEMLSRAAAELFVSLGRSRIKTEARFSVALSGGLTPRTLYKLLATPPYRDAVSWRHTYFFWTDERCVPPDHGESNYRLAYETFLSRVTLHPSNIHRIHGEDGAEAAAARYERDLSEFFGGEPQLDLILLGAGEDGHTASLFPTSPALQETERLALPVHLGPGKKERVTLSLPVLNKAGTALVLASGSSKAPIVFAVLEEGNVKRYPAGLVQPRSGHAIWMIDRKAAGMLTNRPVLINNPERR